MSSAEPEHKDEQLEQTKREDSDTGQDDAAKTIQRNYRGYKGRREMKGCGMSAQGRWREVLKDAQFHNLTEARPKSSKDNSTGSTGKWSRLTGIAARAGDDTEDNNDKADEPEHGQGDEFEYYLQKLRSAKQGEGEYSKTMGLEYWLEMVDQKHRYGTNLLKYHTSWKDSDAQDNFFHWLDEGDGKHEDLEGCPRDKLESQQLHYLSREQRYEYLIIVGEDGLLRWAKDDEKVTTHAPASHEDSEPNANEANTGNADAGQTETQNHATDDLHNARGIIQAAGQSVPAPLAKAIEKNQDKASWIFVVDTQFRIYAGIKQSGGFQHSSFLHGSRVLSAGLISIEDGLLRSLSPHSGHYRPTAENFWILAKCLEAEGVDMNHASIAGSYVMLRTAEIYRDSVSWLKGMMDKMNVSEGTDQDGEDKK